MDIRAETATDVLQKIDSDVLVDHGLVRACLWRPIAGLASFPLIGLIVSIEFHYPTSWLTFVRLHPVHVNGVVFAAFSTPTSHLLECTDSPARMLSGFAH